MSSSRNSIYLFLLIVHTFCNVRRFVNNFGFVFSKEFGVHKIMAYDRHKNYDVWEGI